MPNIELSPEEVEVLRDVLQHNLSELDVEVFRTDTHDFKAKLKHRREVLDHILNKMTVPVPSV